MPRLDPASVRLRTTTTYPPPHDAEARGRSALMLSDAGGLTQFGVNVTILEPGAKSSIRHWHEREDEFVMVLSGELRPDRGCRRNPDESRRLRRLPGGPPRRPHLPQPRRAECRLLVVGTRLDHDVAHYSDIDLKVTIGPEGNRFTRKDGTPYPEKGDQA
jgi:uncharacterized cupin superfamily protein